MVSFSPILVENGGEFHGKFRIPPTSFEARHHFWAAGSSATRTEGGVAEERVGTVSRRARLPSPADRPGGSRRRLSGGGVSV